MKDLLAILRPEGAELQVLPQPVRVLGIDLGTTNSTVAEIVWRADQSEPITSRPLRSYPMA
jgi:molecular chaperone DnaK